jgi:hypothetical protein
MLSLERSGKLKTVFSYPHNSWHSEILFVNESLSREEYNYIMN